MGITRKNIVKFRVNDEEFEFLKKKQMQSNCKTLSAFLRKISLMGAVYIVDMSEITEIRKYIKNISDNVNQIARAVNSQRSIYQEEIEEIQAELSGIQSRFREVFDKSSKMKSR